MALNLEISLTFILSCIAILIAIVCWVWVTCLILKILKFKSEETKLINNIVSDIEKIKQNIRNNFN